MYGFRFYFTPLTGVLFTFPSRYWCAIGHQRVFSLGTWSSRIPTGLLEPRGTQDLYPTSQDLFADRAITFSGRPFLTGSTSEWLCDSAGTRQGADDRLLQPQSRNGCRLSRWTWFGLFPFRSPLLREYSLFLQLLRCFSSLAYLFLVYVFNQE